MSTTRRLITSPTTNTGARAALSFVAHRLPPNVRLVLGVGSPVVPLGTAPSAASNAKAPQSTSTSASSSIVVVQTLIRAAMRTKSHSSSASTKRANNANNVDDDFGPYAVFAVLALRARAALVVNPFGVGGRMLWHAAAAQDDNDIDVDDDDTHVQSAIVCATKVSRKIFLSFDTRF